jgi:4-hydroxy-3-methylbut-2-en-1-yl diphosphate reductase
MSGKLKVIRADTAGFCMGVDLALRKLQGVVEKGDGRHIFTLGPIIHNPQVLEEWEKRGVTTAQSPEEIPPGSLAVIRAHGIPRELEQRLLDNGVEIADATCPKVKRAQVLIAEQSELGRKLLLFGEADHPEVKGLRSYAAMGCVVFENMEALRQLQLDRKTPWFLAAQTTQDRKGFESIQKHLRGMLGEELPVLNTICDATKERQQEALEIARMVEAMVVVGGFSSGNTRRLALVVEGEGIFCVHVETPDQLPLETLRKYSIIGLTGGASTPKSIIDAIETRLREM